MRSEIQGERAALRAERREQGTRMDEARRGDVMRYEDIRE